MSKQRFKLGRILYEAAFTNLPEQSIYECLREKLLSVFNRSACPYYFGPGHQIDEFTDKAVSASSNFTFFAKQGTHYDEIGNRIEFGHAGELVVRDGEFSKHAQRDLNKIPPSLVSELKTMAADKENIQKLRVYHLKYDFFAVYYIGNDSEIHQEIFDKEGNSTRKDVLAEALGFVKPSSL